MHVAKAVLGDIRRVVVATALGLAVRDVVLRRRGDGIGCRERVALVAAHHRAAHLGSQVDVLAEPLYRATPARVARDVEHGGERPVGAARTRLGRREVGEQLHHRWIEARGLRERDWCDGALPVDDVEPDEERDPEPRLLDRDPLQRVGRGGRAGPEHGSDSVAYELRGVLDARTEDDLELAELLGEGQFVERGTDTGTRGHATSIRGGTRIAARGASPERRSVGEIRKCRRGHQPQAASISPRIWSTVFWPVSRPCTPAPRASYTAGFGQVAFGRPVKAPDSSRPPMGW